MSPCFKEATNSFLHEGISLIVLSMTLFSNAYIFNPSEGVNVISFGNTEEENENAGKKKKKKGF